MKDINKILAWDIETAPLEDFGTEHHMFSTWKNRHRKENLSDTELIEKFNKEAGLYAEYSRIVCISCGFLHGEDCRLRSFVGTEEDIITNFLAMVDKFVATRGGIISLGHNIQNFDVPYLRKAFSKYKPMLSFPKCLSDLGEKPWTIDDKMIDTLQTHKGLNYMFSSMAEVALHLGIQSPKLDTDGSQVASLYRAGEIKRISDYCEGDVYTSFCIYLNWLGIAPPNKISTTEEKTEETLVEASPLKRLLLGQTLSDAEMKKLKAKLKKERKSEGFDNIMLAIRKVVPTFEL